jgi:hypothetical protein
MRLLLYCFLTSFIFSCENNVNKQSKSELQEKELNQKKNELKFKQKKYVNSNQYTTKKNIGIIKLQDTSHLTKNTINVPFIGIKKLGEFWLIGSGLGEIPFYSIEIKENGDVYLIKQVESTISDEVIEKKRKLVGKYKTILKGVGEFSPNEYYKITKTRFSIVDVDGNLLKLSGCCNQHSFAETGKQIKCFCDEKFIDF